MPRKKSGLQASTQGLRVIHKARLIKGWSWQVDKNDKPLIVASHYLEPDLLYPIETPSGKIYANKVNEGSWRRFLGGKRTIPTEVFIAYCQALEISWELVVEWRCLTEQISPTFAPEALLSNSFSSCSHRVGRDASKFIRDITIPDGSIMQPGEEFTKIWEIRNVGDVYWKDRYMKRLGSGEGHGLIISPDRIKVPDTAPGESVEIIVQLKAPKVATTTTAFWKMVYSDGRFCFPDKYPYGLFTTIQVIQYHLQTEL